MTIDQSDLIGPAEIAALLGVSESSFRSMPSQPGMPAPLRAVGNTPVWDTGQVLEWWAQSRPTVHVGGGVEAWAEDRDGTVVGVERGTRWVLVLDVDGRRLPVQWPLPRGWLRGG